MISFSASVATACVVAATAATGWPWNNALSRAMTLRHIHRMSWMPSITGPLSIGKLDDVLGGHVGHDARRASRPCEVSIDLMRACGCGLRSTLPQIMPGMVGVGRVGRPSGHLVGAVGTIGARADPLVLAFGIALRPH